MIGYGSSADAFRITDSHDEGRGAIACIRRSARRRASSIPPTSIISTPTAPALPSMIRSKRWRSSGPSAQAAYTVPISSTKSMMGHLIAAAGSVEAIVCLLTIRDGMLPPTINLENPDPECDLDYIPNQARRKQVDVALSNSFGFGGQNITLILRRFSD